VGKCHRIASVGGRWVTRSGRGDRVGSLVGRGWLVVREVFNSLVSVGYGGATSPEVEPTRREFLTVRYGESRRHRRQTRCGCGEQTPRC
jgi:hypothetical protein